VFLIQGENNIDNILTFLVVARHSRTFQILPMAWPTTCKGSWEGM